MNRVSKKRGMSMACTISPVSIIWIKKSNVFFIIMIIALK